MAHVASSRHVTLTRPGEGADPGRPARRGERGRMVTVLRAAIT